MSNNRIFFADFLFSISLRELVSLLLILAILGTPLQSVFAQTGVPRILNYQGRLMNEDGVLLGHWSRGLN